jgi:hypothetical protein
MNKAIEKFDSLIENEINNTGLGYQLLEQHQKCKKGELLCFEIFILLYFLNFTFRNLRNS